ncbi:MAG: RIP metalloprotease RseP [Bacteroidota bacterium]
MSGQRNKSIKNLAIIAGIILASLLIGYLTDSMTLVTDILTAVGLLLVGITILVTVHELGHFLTAKAFGMRVETFSIGFPPKLFSFTRGETEYQIGATPLGGYVKISGIIDESLDTEHLAGPPKPYEFRAKPVWQRLIVMTGGVIMNVILGVLIFTGLKWTYPDIHLPAEEVKYGVEVLPNVESLGSMIGLQTGDSIVSINGRTYPYIDDYRNNAFLLEDDAYFEVYRNNELVKLNVPGNIQNFFGSDTISRVLFLVDAPPIIDVIDSIKDADENFYQLPASKAGLQDGDEILLVDSLSVPLFSDMRNLIRARADKPVNILFKRGPDTMSVVVQVSEEGRIGIDRDLVNIFNFDTVHHDLDTAFILGTKAAFGVLSANIQGFKNLGKEGVDASKSVVGPLQIGKFFLDSFRNYGLEGFFRLTGMLSMILALVNILPIPALDGGHVVFLLIEAITRKEPSPKVRIIAQQIGMVLILGLMLLILFNDTFRLFS